MTAIASDSIRMTVAQAVVKHLQVQFTEVDGQVKRFIPAMWAILGHGNAAGIGQALTEPGVTMPLLQGHNEQSMVHASTAFARETRRACTLAITTSIGPGATNLVTGAALATVNRLPVLLLPADAYATRHQGVVLQQLEHPISGDVSVNDCLRPVSRFFDRIHRPEQLLTALPEALRVLTDPVGAGAATVALPQDVQSHSFDWPAGFFDRRIWRRDRARPDAGRLRAVATLLAKAERPVIVAGGGVWYSDAHAALEEFIEDLRIPVVETYAGKGACRSDVWQLLGGVGVEGTRAANDIASAADLVLCVGTRLTDFVTGSNTLFGTPGTTIVSLNVDARDAHKLGGIPLQGDARATLEELRPATLDAGYAPQAEWERRVRAARAGWREVIDLAVAPDATKPLSGGQVIRTLNESLQAGDVLVSAAGAPPGELHKLWDATGGRRVHIEFGFSCMGYELPGGLGARLARPDGSVFVLVGDGSYLLNPGELATLATERAKVVVVVLDNQGFQIIERLQINKVGAGYGNEFRYRERALGAALIDTAPSAAGDVSAQAPPLAGDYVRLDLARSAEGLGAVAFTASTDDELREALVKAQDVDGPAVVVVSVAHQRWLPPNGCWWDVEPPSSSASPVTRELHEAYLTQRSANRRHRPHSTAARGVR